MSVNGNFSNVSIGDAKCIADSSDRSTDCSDSTSNIVDFPEIDDLAFDGSRDLGCDVEVNAEIDEEDDDLFFSTHKRPSAIAASTREQPVAKEQDASYIVHAEIDEEDDDVFFSTHRQQGECLDLAQEEPAQSIPQDCVNLNLTIVHAEIDEDDDDVFFSTHKQASVCNDDSTEHLMSKQEEGAEYGNGLRCCEIVEKAALPSDPQVDQSMSLRGRDSIGSVGSDNSCNQLKFLGDLKGSRSGGVRKHLERKLTQETDS